MPLPPTHPPALAPILSCALADTLRRRRSTHALPQPATQLARACVKLANRIDNVEQTTTDYARGLLLVRVRDADGRQSSFRYTLRPAEYGAADEVLDFSTRFDEFFTVVSSLSLLCDWFVFPGLVAVELFGRLTTPYLHEFFYIPANANTLWTR